MRSKKSLRMTNRARDKRSLSRMKSFTTLGRNKVNSNRFNQTTLRTIMPWVMESLIDPQRKRKKTLD